MGSSGSEEDYSKEDGYLSVYASDEYSNEGPIIDHENTLRSILQAGSDSNQEEASEEDAVDSLLADFSYSDKCHTKINEKLSNAVNSVWMQKLSKDKIKERLEKHYRPENCEQLIINKVNPELFTSLHRNARSYDIKLQKMQNYNIKAAIPIVKLDI